MGVRDNLKKNLSRFYGAALALSEKDVIYPSVDDIIDINKALHESFRGTHGVLSRDIIQNAILSSQTFRYDNGDDASNIEQRGLVLLEKLALDNAFIDGNKRTALFAWMEFRDSNNLPELSPSISNHHIVNWTTGIANKSITRHDILSVIQASSKCKDDYQLR